MQYAYMYFQAFLFGASLLGAGTIFLMIVSALHVALGNLKLAINACVAIYVTCQNKYISKSFLEINW